MTGFGDVCFVGFSHCRVTDICKIMKKKFYWSIVALQCYVHFYCTEKCIRCAHTYISFLELLPI